MATEPRHFIDETDIGSGEKTPGQLDTEAEVRKVGQRDSTTNKKEETKPKQDNDKASEPENH